MNDTSENTADPASTPSPGPNRAPAGSQMPNLQNLLKKRPVRTPTPPPAAIPAPASVSAQPGGVQTATTAEPAKPAPSQGVDNPGRRGGTRHGRSRAAGKEQRRSNVGQEDAPPAGPQRIVIYLPAEVAEAVRRARRAGTTNADVIFDAIEQVGLDEVSRLVVVAENRRGRKIPAEPGRLFSRQIGSVALNKVRFEARLLATDCEQIDQAVTQTGADSRSELIEIALHKHLLGAQR